MWLFSAQLGHGFNLRRLQFAALFFEALEGGLEVGRGEVAAEDQGGFAEGLFVERCSHHLRPVRAVGKDEAHDRGGEFGCAVLGHFATHQRVAGAQEHVVTGEGKRSHRMSGDDGLHVVKGGGKAGLAGGVVHGILEVAEEKVFRLGRGIERQEGKLPPAADAGERHVLLNLGDECLAVHERGLDVGKWVLWMRKVPGIVIPRLDERLRLIDPIGTLRLEEPNHPFATDAVADDADEGFLGEWDSEGGKRGC